MSSDPVTDAPAAGATAADQPHLVEAAAPATAATTELWVERTGTRTYTGHSSRGVQVPIGPVEAGAVFTPGELLKIALAGCTGMSADAALARHLGDDVAVTVRVSGPSDPAEDRYPAFQEQLVVDLSGLDADGRTRLRRVVERAVEAHCTVARTLTRGAEIDMSIVGES